MGCQSHRPCLVEPSCHPLSLQTRARTHAHSLVNTCTHRHHCATTTTSTITVNTIITTITTITTTRARAGEYITLDDCWGGERHQNGSYWWDEDRFPSGIPALARQLSELFHRFWTISRAVLSPTPPTRAVFFALLGTRADRVLIGACHPTLWPIWGFRPTTSMPTGCCWGFISAVGIRLVIAAGDRIPSPGASGGTTTTHLPWRTGTWTTSVGCLPVKWTHWSPCAISISANLVQSVLKPDKQIELCVCACVCV